MSHNRNATRRGTPLSPHNMTHMAPTHTPATRFQVVRADGSLQGTYATADQAIRRCPMGGKVIDAERQLVRVFDRGYCWKAL